MSVNTAYRVTVTAREQAELQTSIADPTPLGANQVAGKTLASLVSAGTELAGIYLGENFPAHPGYASVFRIEEIGSEVKGFQVGDTVFSMGNHQSWQRTEASACLKVPEGLAPQEAVFARMMGVSMSTLTTTTARPPHKVLVTGLGPVGFLAAAMFSGCGYEVFAIDPVEWRRDLAEENGIARAFPSIARDHELAGQFHLAIECSGHEAATVEACNLARVGGEVVLVGVPWQRKTELYAHDIVHPVFHRYIHLRSGWEWQLPGQPDPFKQSSIWENMNGALRWLAEGRVQVSNLYSLASPRDAQVVYQGLLHNTWPSLAAVFDWTAV